MVETKEEEIVEIKVEEGQRHKATEYDADIELELIVTRHHPVVSSSEIFIQCCSVHVYYCVS